MLTCAVLSWPLATEACGGHGWSQPGRPLRGHCSSTPSSFWTIKTDSESARRALHARAKSASVRPSADRSENSGESPATEVRFTFISLKNPHYLYTFGFSVHSGIPVYTLLLGCTQPTKNVHSQIPVSADVHIQIRIFPNCTQPSDVYHLGSIHISHLWYTLSPVCRDRGNAGVEAR